MSAHVPPVFAAWGKARAPEAADVAWHPLVYHCLDVAAVTEALLHSRPVTRARAAALLGLEEATAVQLLVAFAALHDVGKFAAAFQAKASPDGWYWPTYLGATQGAVHKSDGHTSDGMLLWEHSLADLFRDRLSLRSRNAWGEIAAAVFGHHGRPVSNSGLRTSANIEAVFCTGAQRVAAEWVELVTTLLPLPSVPCAEPTQKQLKIASWWVAGLITLSDWIGSNVSRFPYATPDASDADCRRYWAGAQERAANAVREAGLVSPRPTEALGYRELTRIDTPTPLQAQVQHVLLGDGPLLAIVEDATGSGKTEAAHMLVHRLLGEGRASGAYWAMPTQATANAMYERQGKLLANLYSSEGGPRPSMVLAHGRAELHDAFTNSVIAAGMEPAAHETDEPVDAELPAEVACPAFLADSRRKALLADLGVGTVDQAFLGVLPTRFNTLRLFAMAEKVLVLDEVHAFDEYMRAEAYALLQMQAALGGSAVLLSATLPAAQRQALVRVWQDVVHTGDRLAEPLREGDGAEVPYPLLTLVRGHDATAGQHTFETPRLSRRTVPVRWLRTFDDCLDRIVSAQKEQCCVVWIRNTVGGCLEAAAALRARGVQPLGFHARFTPADRQRFESEVRSSFGPQSRAGERAGRVLVATQVVEQSLDLDFDVMVSDLAPIDLLIQRAGRLWRHRRPRGDRPTDCSMELAVLAQHTEAEPDATWVSSLGSGTEYVYSDLGLLWRTVKQLEATRQIETPASLRMLIERVYTGDEIPSALLGATDRSLAKGYSAKAVGQQNALKASSGYGTDGGRWHSDVHYPTRLSDPTITVRLARVTQAGTLQPWSEQAGEPSWKNWAMSEVSLRRSQLVKGDGAVRPLSEYQRRIDAIRAEWPVFERELLVLPLEFVGGGVWEGCLRVNDSNAMVLLRYSSECGLETATTRWLVL